MANRDVKVIDRSSDTLTKPASTLREPLAAPVRSSWWKVVVSGAVLLLLSASTVAAQRRTRIPVPKSLLQSLAREDRECVLTNGGARRAFRIQAVRLAADGTRQFLIKASNSCLCGAQNCRFWIYRKQGHTYQALLTGEGATKIRPARQSAKGYRDIVSESHASAIETILRTYRFDGQAYQLRRCLTRAYYDKDGHPQNTPTLRPCDDLPKLETFVAVPGEILNRQLTTLGGQQLKLSDYAGRIVVLNLFATWCAPCWMVQPALNEVKQSYSSVAVVGVVMSDDHDIEAIRKSIRDRGLNSDFAIDRDDFAQSLIRLVNGGDTLPQIFVIDERGGIRRHFTGYNPENTPKLLRESLDKMTQR